MRDERARSSATGSIAGCAGSRSARPAAESGAIASTRARALANVLPRWQCRARCERLELDELRHARAAQPIERGLPPHSVANQLGHTDGGAPVQCLDGHPSERGMRGQIRLAFGSWGADEEQAHPDVPANGGVS